MPLLLVQAFVNTWDGDHGRDVLLQPEDARGWLSEAGLMPRDEIPDAAGLRLARDVREAIRALLSTNGGGPAEEETLRPLQVLTGKCRLQASIGPDGLVELAPVPVVPEAGGLAAALFGLVLLIRDAQADGTWPRLKACRNPECRWAFYDRSHSRRGTWCDMAICGNRIKNRTLRERQRA